MTVDREKKIAEIREALEKATPGPWFAVKVDSDSYSISSKPGYYGHSITGWGRVLQTKEDAHLIANAPEWLRYLLSELERLERESLRWKEFARKQSVWKKRALDFEEKLIQALEALNEFVEKNFHGSAKAHREDYVIMVSAADIYQLRQAIQQIKGRYDMNRGDKYRPVVIVPKVKRGVPTVIRVAGREYVLRTPDQFNQRKKGAVRR